jgi:hypothetical protein
MNLTWIIIISLDPKPPGSMPLDGMFMAYFMQTVIYTISNRLFARQKVADYKKKYASLGKRGLGGQFACFPTS